jgi:putative tryptophan/tyrosine transport system substrate-binding protein
VGLLFLLASYPVTAASQSAADNLPVGIIISKEIRPFIRMVEGLEENLSVPSCRVFFDKGGMPYGCNSGAKGFSPGRFSVTVAVGPQALEYLLRRNWSGPVVYGMILNPEAIIGGTESLCGVSLNIPYWGQISSIHKIFPQVRRLGILYDPANNQAWFDRTREISELQGITVIPLIVTKKNPITRQFDEKIRDLDAIMFIPDRTVISQAVVQYVIKRAILQGVPSIGYNRFFHDSGAALSFVIDYKTLGKRVAGQVKNILTGKPCSQLGPDYKIMLNDQVIKKLRLSLGSNLPETVERD